MDLKEYFSLFFLNLKVKIYFAIEYIYVVWKYYRYSLFRRIDLSLLSSYFFANPFRLSKDFLLKRGEKEIYTYGETPLTTLDLIAKQCEITSQDVVFELGCGRGRTCFWLHAFTGCFVIGIDYVPLFIEKAKMIQKRFHLERIDFRLQDLFQADLKEATVIYLYGTCFSEEQIHQLIHLLRQLRKGTRIITVSYSLKEYDANAPFHILKQLELSFPWGRGDVYLQIKE